MTAVIHSNTSRSDAVECLLMASVARRMEFGLREMFWETLPDRIPDLTSHLPALISAVRDETSTCVLDKLSFHPLPATLSPETAGWRAELVAVWERRLKKARNDFDKRSCPSAISEYIASLSGLIQVDRCAMPPGATCPSLLPTLLNEAPYACEKFTRFFDSCRFECLATLANWRPAPNVITDPVVLNAWTDFWLELYQQENRGVGEEEPKDFIILKGIAAKALLNLVETDGKETTRLPEGIEPLLLESLMKGVMVGGTTCPPTWLSWQPRDVTSFPLDRLAELSRTLLNRFRVSCQNICYNIRTIFNRDVHKEMKKVMQPLLTDLVRWDRAGLLPACGIDLLPVVVTEMNNYLNTLRDEHDFNSEDLLNHEVCRWLVRDEVAEVKEGKELLQRLENYWQYECETVIYGWTPSKCIAWNARMQLQRAGLATETPADFHESLLKAIKRETHGQTHLVLSLWSPEKDASGKERMELRSLWKNKLESYDPAKEFSKGGIVPPDKESSKIAILTFLGQNPADGPVVRQQKLREFLRELPKQLRPTLSIAEITHLVGESSVENPHLPPYAGANQRWQFRPDETRFRVPTERSAKVSTPAISAAVQTARPDSRPDRMVQRIVGGDP